MCKDQADCGALPENSPAGSFTITCDGWKNIKRDPVVNIMNATPTPIFYKVVETGDNSHTGEYMSAIIKEGIIAVGGMVDYTDFTSRGISAVVTADIPRLVKSV